MQRAYEITRQRHVHAMIVARRKVDGDELPVGIRYCGVCFAEQLGGAVILSLGLEYAAVADRAGLADTSVGRAQQRRRIGILRTRVGLQRPREERIEMRVRVGSGLRGFAHVDAIALRDLPDQEILPWTPGPARRPVHDARKQAMRQQVLHKHAGTHQRVSIRTSRSARIVSAANGGRNRPSWRPSGSMITTAAL